MKETSIKWGTSTFNPWWGCSVNCDYCYARSIAKRVGYPEAWEGGPYRLMTDDYWDRPLKWNEEAKEKRNA